MRPTREIVNTGGHTYFVSSQTADRRPFLRHERWAILMEEVLQHYRGGSYLLHAYVVMPDHFHAMISPSSTVERSMQSIKGGFAFRAKKAFEWRFDVWQVGFSDHRIRDVEDCDRHLSYISHNPVKARLSASPENYRYLQLNLDPIPQRPKPLVLPEFNGGAKAPPLQRKLG